MKNLEMDEIDTKQLDLGNFIENRLFQLERLVKLQIAWKEEKMRNNLPAAKLDPDVLNKMRTRVAHSLWEDLVEQGEKIEADKIMHSDGIDTSQRIEIFLKNFKKEGEIL